MDEIISKLMNLTLTTFWHEDQPIFNINVFYYFKHLHIGFKKNCYFYKKRTRTFPSKWNKKNDEALNF